MNANNALKLMHANAHRRFRTEVTDLTADQLAWSPAPEANAIGFLIWHVSRVEDMKVARLLSEGWTAGEPLVKGGWPARGEAAHEVWNREGWAERFGYAGGGYGFGFSHDEAHTIPAIKPDLLLGYFDAITAASQSFLGGMTADRVEPAVQIGLITHTIGHLGAVQYTKGLQGVASGQGT